MNQDEGRITGVSDLTYNLISIAYHALQGIDTYNTYLQDAESSGDEQCAAFIRETMEQNKQRAAHAVELLARHLNEHA